MQLISIDVGIKNLAYCILASGAGPSGAAPSGAGPSEAYKIIKWDSINLCGEEPTCKECKKKASYTKNELNYCLTHAKKTGFIIPTKEIEASAIKKMKLDKLISLANEYQLEINSNDKKDVILKTILDYFLNNSLQKTSKTSANHLDLVTIGISLKNEFDKIMPCVNINEVIIENQISPIANRMKTIQGMIAQYFIMRGITQVTFVSSMNKLKGFMPDKDKTEYKERKKLGIEVTKGILASDLKEWISIFLEHKKKDDLADSFLQGIWFLQKNYNLQLTYVHTQSI